MLFQFFRGKGCKIYRHCAIVTGNIKLHMEETTLAGSECTICAEKYSKMLRSRVACPYCAFEACSACCQKFLLTETAPRCMLPECRREWTRAFIVATFPAVFVNKRLKAHREQVIFDQERALLPATQPLVENILNRRRIASDIARINLEIARLYGRRNDMQIAYNATFSADRETTAERRQFVRACPADGCRGFLSTQWKCELCEQWTCPQCNELKGPAHDSEHTCHPDQLASAALMRHDTKPCPTCGMGIFRISGCPQMFCTSCHTAFCWNTGRIETNVHNPHYFEWLRQTGGDEVADNRLPGQGPGGGCRQVLDTRFIRSLRQNVVVETSPIVQHLPEASDRVWRIAREIMHIRDIEVPRYQVNRVTTNQKLRIKYLLNEIDEEQLKVLLQRCDKRNQKHHEIYEVLDTVQQAATDILFRLLDHATKVVGRWGGSRCLTKEHPGFVPFLASLKELDALNLYANQCLAGIATAYNSVPLALNERFVLNR